MAIIDADPQAIWDALERSPKSALDCQLQRYIIGGCAFFIAVIGRIAVVAVGITAAARRTRGSFDDFRAGQGSQTRRSHHWFGRTRFGGTWGEGRFAFAVVASSDARNQGPDAARARGRGGVIGQVAAAGPRRQRGGLLLL